ncbi:MAG: endonuclease III [Acholeplasmataceae bacterium]|jgi:endonuclease-3|nr:endonuclease III [Acholeplasmataceae bacterium]
MDKVTKIITVLEEMFPKAKAELDFSNNYQLLVAVILSAQTTDIAVNRVTPAFFAKYPTPEKLAKANPKDVENIIKSIGLFRNKSRHLIAAAKLIETRFNGLIPNTRKDLESLPGVGRKTANVVLANAFGIPTLAVDTHVHRVSIRLGLVNKDDNVYKTEQKLYKIFPQDKWIKLHHQLIFFGRYQCLAKKPKCGSCALFEICVYEKKDKTSF